MRMNKMRSLFLPIICLILCLSGCIIPESSHVEPDFYLLSDTKLANNENNASGIFSFYLREIELPRYLKDPRMVFRPTEHMVEFREIKRWGEPLEDGIARTTSQNLYNQSIDSRFSIFPNRRKDNLRWDLSISFSSFEKVSNHTLVEAQWSAKDKTGTFVSGKYSSGLIALKSSDINEELNNYNKALHDLAGAIIQELSSK